MASVRLAYLSFYTVCSSLRLVRPGRMSGYITLAMLIITPLLALDSDWLRSNSSVAQRWWIGAGLGVAGLGVFLRIRCVFV